MSVYEHRVNKAFDAVKLAAENKQLTLDLKIVLRDLQSDEQLATLPPAKSQQQLLDLAREVALQELETCAATPWNVSPSDVVEIVESFGRRYTLVASETEDLTALQISGEMK